MLLLHETAQEWGTSSVTVRTPLGDCAGKTLSSNVVFVPILRAGLGMLEGMLKVLPDAIVGQIGLYRNEETLQPVSYFCRLPPNLPQAQVVILDPMLATGGSASKAAALLKTHGATRIQFVCVIACPAGIHKFHSEHADVPIIAGEVDPELNQLGYIVPGLGDAGDRYFGTG